MIKISIKCYNCETTFNYSPQEPIEGTRGFGDPITTKCPNCGKENEVD